MSPQNLLVSWHGEVSRPSLRGDTTISGWRGGRSPGQSSLQGGPKQVIDSAGRDSSPQSAEGARPPRSHSHDTERRWVPPPQVVEHWKGHVRWQERRKEDIYLRPLAKHPDTRALGVVAWLGTAWFHCRVTEVISNQCVSLDAADCALL